MNEMSAGVAMLFFKTGEQFIARRVTCADHVDGVRAGRAEGTMYAGTQANCCFRHADNEHRPWQIFRYLRRETVKARVHDRRTHRDMAAQYFGHE